MTKQTPKALLRNWVKANGKTASILAEEIGFTYQHAWNILEGQASISLITLAKLLVAYGADGPAPAMAEAMRRHKSNGNHET